MPLLGQFSRSRRSVAAGLLSAVPALVILVSWLAWRRVLPPRIATHWSETDRPDGFASTGVLLGITLAVSVVVAAACIWSGVDDESPANSRSPLLIGGIFSGVAMSVWLTCSALATSRVDAVGGWFLLTILGAGYGLVPCLATLGAPTKAPAAPGNPIVLDSTEEGSWSRSVDSNLMLAFALGVAVLGGCLLWIPSGGRATWVSVSVSALLGVVCLFMAALSRLTVAVDQHGFHVRSDVIRVRVKSIPLQRIASVTSEMVVPAEWGGWGYRVLPTRSAIVLRSGEGIVVRTKNNRRFAVTVSDPEQGVALLAGFLGRR